MEITYFPKNCIKIKGKHSALVVDPIKSVKTSAPAVVLLNTVKDTASLLSSELEKESRVVIVGPGEYEVSGLKITGSRYEGDETVYTVLIDNIEILLTKGSVLEKVHTKVKEHQIVICNANTMVSGSSILAVSPKLVILYGEKAKEVASQMGKTLKPVNKLSVTGDKIPLEVEVVLLG